MKRVSHSYYIPTKTVRNRICRYVYLLFFRILIIFHFLRQIHMNFLNTVFIQRFYNQSNTIGCCDRIAEFRKPVQMLDDKSTEGIIFFRFQIQFQMVIEVVQVDRTFYQIFFVRNFVNKIFFILVIFVMNFTDNFFQDIFQCCLLYTSDAADEL